MAQTPSFRQSRDVDESNKFGQMQELTNDHYSDFQLYGHFHIEYKAWDASLPFQCEEFVNKANGEQSLNRFLSPDPNHLIEDDRATDKTLLV